MQGLRFVLLLVLNGLLLEGVPPAAMEDSGPVAENLTPGGYWQAQLTPNFAASVLHPSIAHVDFSRRVAKETRIDPALVAIQKSPLMASVKSPTSPEFRLL